jgi:hypothetical protein
MGKQHHFVVVFDTEDHEFRMEEETLFFDGTIFDEESQEWTKRVDDDTDYALNEVLYGTLSTLLIQYNEHGVLPQEIIK